MKKIINELLIFYPQRRPMQWAMQWAARARN
jgi:hypothetical protein